MSQLVYSEEALMQTHSGLAPHVEAGRRLHGGFDAAGHYVPPRVAVRGPAVAAWTEALRARGGDWLRADASLLEGIRVPNTAQMKLLLREGLGQTFWNTLTITGHIEARGRILADPAFPWPDLQKAIVEDISEMGIGHLKRGLLRAHGLDEGGEPERGIGGHDVMWFALRDLAFGDVDWPEPEIPERIARPEELQPRIDGSEGIDGGVLQAIDFLANLLMIEFRAELGFQMSQDLLRDPELFTERRAEAERAAEIVGRIRADEAIHVESLRLYLGELRAIHFHTTAGPLAGCDVVDPIWEGIVRWAVELQPEQVAEQQRTMLRGRIQAHPEGERVWRAFQALDGA